MHQNDVKARVKALEQQVAHLSKALGLTNAEGKLQLSSKEAAPPGLRFMHSREGDTPQVFGTIGAGDFGNGYHALRVKGVADTRLDLSSNSDVLLRAGETLNINTPIVKIESSRVDMDGELSARLCATGQFTWESGSPPVRLVHQSHGIPVLTELKGKFKNNSSGIKMYVDPEDGYWYLTGDSSKGAEIFARVICIGRV